MYKYFIDILKYEMFIEFIIFGLWVYGLDLYIIYGLVD